MNLKQNEELLYAYNRKEEALVLLFQGDNDSIYRVGGWFGRKLHEFLQEDGNLEKFFQETVFKSNDKLREIFHRLLATLVQENIFLPPEEDGFTLGNPFSQEECHHFGEGDLVGSLAIEELEFEEFLAYAVDGDSGVPPSADAKGPIPNH